MKTVSWVFAIGTLIASTANVYAEHVEGNFTVKGVTTPLAHAYAFWKSQEPFRPGVDLYVLLSDTPLDSQSLPSNDDAVAKVASLVRDGKIHALELHFADGGKSLNAAEEGAVYHVSVAPARHGLGGVLQYKSQSVENKILRGHVSTKPDAEELVGFKVDGTFEVTIPPKK